jgi:hypothetical protein
MSGLAAREHREEPGEISVLISEGQMAQMLCNLCWQLFTRDDRGAWKILVDRMETLFHIRFQDSVYIRERAELTLSCKDLQRDRVELDRSSSGRDCQQVLMLLAFMLAEPDAVAMLVAIAEVARLARPAE